MPSRGWRRLGQVSGFRNLTRVGTKFLVSETWPEMEPSFGNQKLEDDAAIMDIEEEISDCNLERYHDMVR